MNELMKFEGMNVSILIKNDEPLFELYSTGMALGQSRKNSVGTVYPRKDRIDENVKSAEIQPCVRNGHKYITESQLYDLMLEMKTDKVKPFRRWITNTVLPTIRRTGGYISNTEQFVNTYFGGVNETQRTLITAILDGSKQQSEEIKVLKPKADYTDKVLDSKETITATQLAKLFGMTANAFNRKLNEIGIQYKVGDQWVLYKKYQSKGYTQTKTYCDNAGHPHDATHWTQKGKHFIVGEFEKLGIYANGGNQK